MSTPARRDRAPVGVQRIRWAGAAVLALLVALTAFEAPWTQRLQAAWWDLHQAVWPRRVEVLPVTVVEIDQKSLLALGQWPWPRTQLARLLQAIHAAEPAAVALDLLLAESDALSPEQLLAGAAASDPALAAALRERPSNDAVLAQTLQALPTVLVFAGLPEANAMPLRSAPVTVAHKQPGTHGALTVATYAGALSSIDALNRHAAGWGLVSVDLARGVVRRMPLVASVNGTLVPSLAVEMLRVAARAPSVRVSASREAVRQVGVGGLAVRTESDGAVRPYFSPRRSDRFVSAIDVLQGKVEASMLRHQLVLIGPTALGLHDLHETPVGQRMPGAEIHAQLLENLLGGTLLRRPPLARVAEALLLLAFGAALIWATPRWRPGRAGLLLLALAAVPLAVAAGLFVSLRWLVDAATPALYLLLLFLGLLVLTLTDSMRQRGRLERVVQTQREQAARVAGEIAAAQAIQMGTLPRMELLHGDARVELHATLTPAREVGGDLYDFFRLDGRRLFVLVGDVAGKGLSASLFMAVSKALLKGAMLRAPHEDVGAVLAAANAEVSRDNTAQLYVTVFAAVLDLDTGELRYCNAGHDNPHLIGADGGAVERIGDGDGPPLCVMDDYPYRSACRWLKPGDTLCLMTDGATEAQDPAGHLYGPARVAAVIEAWRHADDRRARTLVDALQADVNRFAAGAEPADDLTLLALRWHGPTDPGAR